MTHHVFFLTSCVYCKNMCLVIKHMNSKKTRDMVKTCSCVFDETHEHQKTVRHVFCIDKTCDMVKMCLLT